MYLHEQLSIYIFTLRDRFYRKPSYDTNMTKRTQIFFCSLSMCNYMTFSEHKKKVWSPFLPASLCSPLKARFFQEASLFRREYFVCCALLKNMSNCYDLYMADDLLKNLAFIQMNQHMYIEYSLPWWTHGELVIKAVYIAWLFI